MSDNKSGSLRSPASLGRVKKTIKEKLSLIDKRISAETRFRELNALLHVFYQQVPLSTISDAVYERLSQTDDLLEIRSLLLLSNVGWVDFQTYTEDGMINTNYKDVHPLDSGNDSLAYPLPTNVLNLLKALVNPNMYTSVDLAYSLIYNDVEVTRLTQHFCEEWHVRATGFYPSCRSLTSYKEPLYFREYRRERNIPDSTFLPIS